MPNFRPSWTDSQLAMWTHHRACQASPFARGRSEGLPPIGREADRAASPPWEGPSFGRKRDPSFCKPVKCSSIGSNHSRAPAGVQSQ
jgi:hypothetical protein